MTNTGSCYVYGNNTAWKCHLCDKRVCLFDKKAFKRDGCAFDYHNDFFFGLTKSDQALYGTKDKEWSPPIENKIASNAMRIKTIRRELTEEEGA